MPIRHNKHPRGSALLVAMLVMGVLMVVTLGLTDLIIREMRLEADVSKAGKAYYAAEAGIEQALLEVHAGLPGVEVENKSGEDLDSEASYTYSIHGRSNSIPDLSGVKLVDDSQKYIPLRQNESMTIPLFYKADNGEVKHIKNFYVAYYMQPLELNVKKVGGAGLTLNDVDVLRWKIFGLRGNTTPQRTESISDYISVGIEDTYQSPRCFGTNVDSSDAGKCKDVGSAKGNDYVNDGLTIKACSLTEARTYYAYNDDGSLDKDKLSSNACHSISEFFSNHEYNYLTLTNAVNLDFIKGKQGAIEEAGLPQKKALATIYYRIVPLDDSELPLSEIKITARGEFGDLRQDIQVNVGREQFLPVFNFSLYRFDSEK